MNTTKKSKETGAHVSSARPRARSVKPSLKSEIQEEAAAAVAPTDETGEPKKVSRGKRNIAR